ncbi:YggT family protein [Prochlorothrix hollandica]|uniref:Membrane protein n=1 Tax=Prochlorothrix hollandica PCC 9006 = CALU 1027 TaxID=317619 RepID=A0A0M2PSK8_PROHO|nr:YggT family protein [Prochlorothrix hollandica]KKI99109.1 membrane protein [Prochlorothrix hollandica PCC 9006 = CALU 1027]
MSATYLLVNTLSTTVSFYTLLIFVRILLSWFPNVDWYNQPFATLGQLTDPYLNLFRSLIPPLGGLDLSPILGIFLLQFVSEGLQKASMSLMY